MSPRRPRHLSAEERALWGRVARSTNRRTPSQKSFLDDAQDEPVKAPAKPLVGRGQLSKLKTSGFGQKPGNPPPVPQSAAPAPAMDRKAFQAMTRGKKRPDSRIDLHGLTLAEAHPRLIDFVLGANARGHRLILVITGKGKDRDTGGPIPERMGKLKQFVPMWLQQAPVAPLVLQVSPAHIKHGGDGAYYVYLRRNRQTF